jgi:hypothetical protein
MFGGLAKAGDVLVGNGINGNLFGFDARSGAPLWHLRLPDMTFSSPLVAPGVIFTGSDDGTVTAFETSSAAAPKLDRYVYSFTDEPAASAFWFKSSMLAGFREGFATAAYALLGNAELGQALAAPIAGKGRKIIILADTRLPDGIDGTKLRSFLDGGGILVLIGPDPLVYSFDESGAPVGIDADKERDYGYNVSRPTSAAARLGLTASIVTNGWARPDQVSVPLALDRSGMATAWIKKFDNGGMLIELPLPRNRAIDLSPAIDAIELAAARSAAGLM